MASPIYAVRQFKESLIFFLHCVLPVPTLCLSAVFIAYVKKAVQCMLSIMSNLVFISYSIISFIQAHDNLCISVHLNIMQSRQTKQIPDAGFIYGLILIYLPCITTWWHYLLAN